jgi:single-stranded-DNA-specific exonuclease
MSGTTNAKNYENFKNAVKHAKDYFLSTFYSLDPLRKDNSTKLKPGNEPRFECFEPKFRPIVRIISHYDADGLSSAGILARAFLRNRIPFQISILKQLEEANLLEILNRLPKHSHDFFIFSDFGTSQYSLIKQNLKFPFLILDHHSPDENQEIPREAFHVNPHFFGIDGTYEISGAGVVYFFAKYLNPNNTDLSTIALVGATGDIQTKSATGDFIGLNLEIQNDAIASKEIEIQKDLNIDRNSFLPKALAFTLRVGMDIPGITGNVKSCEEFIKMQGIRLFTDLNEIRTLSMLTMHEKQKLNSALLKHMFIDLHLPKELMNNLFSVYHIIKSPVYQGKIADAREFSSLLNACGRMGNPSVGIGVILGDEKAFETANSILKKYKESLAIAIKYAKEYKISKNNIYVIDGKDIISENIIGTIASILNFEKESPNDKPILAFAESNEGFIKISTRSPESLIQKGLDLSLAIKNSAEKIGLGQISGGHKASAGAKIPKDKISEFIQTFDEEIATQMHQISVGSLE